MLMQHKILFRICKTFHQNFQIEEKKKEKRENLNSRENQDKVKGIKMFCLFIVLLMSNSLLTLDIKDQFFGPFFKTKQLELFSKIEIINKKIQILYVENFKTSSLMLYKISAVSKNLVYKTEIETLSEENVLITTIKKVTALINEVNSNLNKFLTLNSNEFIRSDVNITLSTNTSFLSNLKEILDLTKLNIKDLKNIDLRTFPSTMEFSILIDKLFQSLVYINLYSVDIERKLQGFRKVLKQYMTDDFKSIVSEKLHFNKESLLDAKIKSVNFNKLGAILNVDLVIGTEKTLLSHFKPYLLKTCFLDLEFYLSEKNNLIKKIEDNHYVNFDDSDLPCLDAIKDDNLEGMKNLCPINRLDKLPEFYLNNQEIFFNKISFINEQNINHIIDNIPDVPFLLVSNFTVKLIKGPQMYNIVQNFSRNSIIKVPDSYFSICDDDLDIYQHFEDNNIIYVGMTILFVGFNMVLCFLGIIFKSCKSKNMGNLKRKSNRGQDQSLQNFLGRKL